MKRIQITADHGSSHSAWTKAPADVATIAEGLGFERVAAGRFWLGDQTFVKRVLRKLCLQGVFNRLCWKLELASLRRRFGKDGGELLLQHPLPSVWTFNDRNIDDLALLKKSGVVITVVVHDIVTFHRENPDVVQDGTDSEMRLFSVCSKLIVHNESMLRYLSSKGVPADKMVPLKIFDYLTETPYPNESRDARPTVLVAGGMGGWKASYLERLRELDGIGWNLYGIDYDPARIGGEHVKYCGCFAPDELPGKLVGDFGLVWHGNTLDTCAGVTGDYLKINNPHKLSLYLSSGLPVIIWSEAAEADFVIRNHVGFAVQTLRDVKEKLKGITPEEYSGMRNAALKVAQKLRSGFFLKQALECPV